MNWKEDQTDTHLKHVEVKPINDDDKEPNLKATLVSKDCEESQNQIGNQRPPQLQKQTMHPPQDIDPHKKIISIMNDFLWLPSPLTGVHQLPV